MEKSLVRKLLTILTLLVSINAFGFDVTKDTTISGNWNLQGAVLNIYGKISGTGIITNAIISANPYIQIFGENVTLQNCKTKEISTAWFGCNSTNADNSVQFQKSINTCISNNIKNLYVASSFSFSQPIRICNLYNDTYIGVDINIYGDGGFWSDATTLTFTGLNYWAIGFQVAKGGSIHNLKLQGQWVAPANTGPAYYNLTQDQFNDASGRCGYAYTGLRIDYDGSKNVSGSTGLRVYDMWITGFDVLFSISPNWSTFNADNLIFTNIRCGNARIGFQLTQPQEKGNEINHITSWDNIHTLISIGSQIRSQAGNYKIDGGNIAGSCIRLFNINQKGWFPSHISNIYAESIGTVGNLFTGDSQNKLPLSVNACVFDFAYPSQAGNQTLLTTNNCSIKFSSCTFRYYGLQDSLKFSGAATFDNCFFSGKVIGNSSCPLTFQQLITKR